MFSRMKPMILHVLFVLAPLLFFFFFFFELKCSEKEPILAYQGNSQNLV